MALHGNYKILWSCHGTFCMVNRFSFLCLFDPCVVVLQLFIIFYNPVVLPVWRMEIMCSSGSSITSRQHLITECPSFTSSGNASDRLEKMEVGRDVCDDNISCLHVFLYSKQMHVLFNCRFIFNVRVQFTLTAVMPRLSYWDGTKHSQVI